VTWSDFYIRNWPHRYSSCSCCWDDHSSTWSKECLTLRSVVSKFDMIVPQANMHPLMEPDFWFDVKISRRRPWRHFTQNCAVAWWMSTASSQHLPSSTRQFLIYSTFVIQPPGLQESWAIVKMPARSALYMGALKIFERPWVRPRLFFPNF